jgi:hypothetical protein
VGFACTTMRYRVDSKVTTIRDRSCREIEDEKKNDHLLLSIHNRWSQGSRHFVLLNFFFSAVGIILAQSSLDTHRTSDFRPSFSIVPSRL